MTLNPGHRVVVHAWGESPPQAIAAHTTLEAMPFPDPAALAPDDVVVAVRSAQVGWVDLLMSSGQYQHMAAPPYTPGLEYAGEVAFVGPGAAGRVALGDRVVADGFATGPRSLGAYQRWGGFASWAVAPTEALRPLPEDWTFDEGASLLGSYETAYHCLVARGRLEAGQTVLIHGASGATGLAAVHIAKLLGARVIATGRSAAKLAIVHAEGADVVVDVSESVGGVSVLRDAVRRECPEGVDVVYDGVGGPISGESLRCMRFGGRFLVVGWASTPAVAGGRGARGAPNANQLPTNLIMMKGLDVLGCPTAISTHRDPSIRPARLAQIDAWVAAGALRPKVAAVFELADFSRAMMEKWTSMHVGAVVLRP